MTPAYKARVVQAVDDMGPRLRDFAALCRKGGDLSGARKLEDAVEVLESWKFAVEHTPSTATPSPDGREN